MERRRFKSDDQTPGAALQNLLVSGIGLSAIADFWRLAWTIRGETR